MRGWGGGEYQDIKIFRQKFLVPHCRKISQGNGEPFFVSQHFWYRKKIMDERGEYHDFMSKVFCLTVPKNFVREPFCAVFQKSSRCENVYG